MPEEPPLRIKLQRIISRLEEIIPKASTQITHKLLQMRTAHDPQPLIERANRATNLKRVPISTRTTVRELTAVEIAAVGASGVVVGIMGLQMVNSILNMHLPTVMDHNQMGLLFDKIRTLTAPPCSRLPSGIHTHRHQREVAGVVPDHNQFLTMASTVASPMVRNR
jgi:hypothetical protein